MRATEFKIENNLHHGVSPKAVLRFFILYTELLGQMNLLDVSRKIIVIELIQLHFKSQLPFSLI